MNLQNYSDYTLQLLPTTMVTIEKLQCVVCNLGAEGGRLKNMAAEGVGGNCIPARAPATKYQILHTSTSTWTSTSTNNCTYTSTITSAWYLVQVQVPVPLLALGTSTRTIAGCK